MEEPREEQNVVAADESLKPNIVCSPWLPAPLPDPILIRRIQKIRWYKGVAATGLVVTWLCLLWLMLRAHVLGMLGSSIQFLIPLTVVLWRLASTKKASAYIGDLIDLPVTIAQFPVEVVYSIHTAAYGNDEGLISFVDGWVHFQGRRTSWSIYARDAVHVAPATKMGMMMRKSKTQGRMYGSISHYLTWTHNSVPFCVELIPQDSLEGLGGGLRKKLGEAFRAWDHDTSAKPGPGVFPPTQAIPTLLRRLEVRARGLKVITPVTGLLTLVASWAAWQLNTYFAVLALIGLAATALAFVAFHVVNSRLHTILYFCSKSEDAVPDGPQITP